MTEHPASSRSPRPRPAIWLAGVVALSAILVGCSASPSGGPHLNWNYFFDSVLRPDDKIRFGIWLTVSISVVSQLIGVALGTLAALGKMAKIRPLRWLANLYVWFFRGTPLLVQIVFFYFGLSVARIWLWPAIDIAGVTIDGKIQAGVFALGINEGAYFAEIVRAGILAIDPGQAEAGKALGMTYGKVMGRIVLPQAARVIIPPLGNEFNNMLKTTALLSAISVPELYTIFSQKQGNAFAPFEFFLAAAVWFLVLTTIWGFIQAWVERKFAKGTGATRGPSFRERLFGGSRNPAEEVVLVSGGR